MKLITDIADLRFPPHTCIVSDRRDGALVDFEHDCVHSDPHVYIRAALIEKAAVELLGMVHGDHFADLQEELRKAQAEVDRLNELIEASEELKGARERVRQALAADAESETSAQTTPEEEQDVIN